jgi:hypothetical protein
MVTLNSGGAVSLSGANQVTNLVVADTGGSVSFTNDGSLNIGDGASVVTTGINASGRNVFITTTGASSDINQDDRIIAGALTVNAGGDVTLSGANQVTNLVIAGAGGSVSFFNKFDTSSQELTVNAATGPDNVEITEGTGKLNINGLIKAKTIELGAAAEITMSAGAAFEQPDTSRPEHITFTIGTNISKDSSVTVSADIITIEPYGSDKDIAVYDNGTGLDTGYLNVDSGMFGLFTADEVIVGNDDCKNISVGNTAPLNVGNFDFTLITKISGEIVFRGNTITVNDGQQLKIIAGILTLDSNVEIKPLSGTAIAIIFEINGLLTSVTNKIDAGNGSIQIYPAFNSVKDIQYGDTRTDEIMPGTPMDFGRYIYYKSEWQVLNAGSYSIGKPGYNGGIYISGVGNATCELTVINNSYIYFYGSYVSANKTLKLTTNEIRFLHTAHINVGNAGLTLDKNIFLMPHASSQTVVAAGITASGDIIITNQSGGSPGTVNSLTITNGAGKTWIGGNVNLSGDFTYTGSSVTFVEGTRLVPTPPPETALSPPDPPVVLRADGEIKFNTPRIDGNIVVNGYITAASGQNMPFYGNLKFTGPADAARNIDNGAWLVFAGNREQRFDSGGSVNPMGNIRIEKTGGAKLLVVDNSVIQKNGAELYIRNGLLNLTETVPSTDALKTWTMGTALGGPVDPGTFTGISGKLSLGDDSGTGAGLKAADITFQGAFGLSAAGVNNTITATGNITIAKDAAGSVVKDFEKVPVVMFPGGTAGEKKISSQEELGTLIILRPALVDQNLNVRHMQLGALGYTDLGSTIIGDYKTGIYLNSPGPGVTGPVKITVHGNWTNHVIDVNNSTDNITTAFRGIAEVVFDSTANPAKVVEITGNSAWYAFTCVSPGVTIKFDNYPKRHYISGRFTLNGGANVGDYIILTRLNDAGEPARKPGTTKPLLPMENAEHVKFWDFVVAPKTADTKGTEINISNLVVMFSNASLRLPIPPKERNVWAYPYFSPGDPYDPANPGFVYTPGVSGDQYSYYNINWIYQYSFFYAYTEDANGNGRIDRIRAQAAFELNASDAGAFDKFVVKVKIDEAAPDEWIPVKGYGPVPNFPESIYIYLEEHEYADGGAENLFVGIENNESLMDLATGLSPIQGSVLTTDTVFPRITYALMLPGSNKAFVQFSEEIDDSVIEFSYPGYPPLRGGQAVPVDGKKNEFELSFPAGTGYDVKTLASGLEFTVKGVRDNVKWVVDRNTDDPDVPSPKYPRDVKYGDYVTVPGNPGEWTAPPTVTVLYPPNGLPVPGGFPNGELSHRITDMLVSLPPTGTQPPANDPFFAWPVWAINPQEKDSITEQRQDIHVVRKFAGHDYLEDKDITLEVNMNEAFAETHVPQLVFRAAVPDAVRAGAGPVDPHFGVPHGNTGLWLNDFESRVYPNNERPGLPPMPENPYAFSNLVPRPYGLAYTRPADGESSNGRVFNFKLLKTAASEYTYGVSMLEFFLLLSPRNNPQASPSEDPSGYLYIGQLGEGTKPWYRRVAPFMFEIHNITRQRSGVTILNNVIKPSSGEKVYLDYHLSRNGPVTIQVFTLDGTLVKVLVRENKSSGEYRTDWDGRNNGGRDVARGMYFIRVVAPDIDEIRKVMVVK